MSLITPNPSIDQLSKLPTANKVKILRDVYPEFCFRSHSMERSQTDIQVTFSLDALSTADNFPSLSFAPTLTFRDVPPDFMTDQSATKVLLFHIGLAEMFSYWKATCSPRIHIEADSLDDDQIAWWSDLLLNGMGEYFLVNGIDPSAQDFVKITLQTKSADSHAMPAMRRSAGYLVPLGGGRDSAIAAEVLKQSALHFRCMVLKPIPSALRVANIANGALPPIIVERTIDARLLDLNKLGFLNGHVPFSAHLGFVAAFCLYAYDFGTIVVANERSADEANAIFHGREINHQYSKSYRFEEKLDRYIQKYLLPDARYVSLVRSLYELQIGRVFAGLRHYHGVFRSCNRNQKQDGWCCECAKCVSVYITTYPFIGSRATNAIFGRDIFKLPSTIPILQDLSGTDSLKPLDCVCTRAEALAGLYLSVERAKADDLPLPPVLEFAAGNILPAAGLAAESASKLLVASGPDRLPPQLKEALNRLLGGLNSV
jgi:hypothetical protein